MYDFRLMEQYIGSLLRWRLLDPIGGMVLSLYIIFEWVKTLLENFAKREAPDSLRRRRFEADRGV